MLDIKNLLGKRYLESVKVVHYGLLFPPNWEALVEGRCPMCNNKMTIPRAGKIVFCKGKKHGKSFVLTLDKFNKIRKKYGRS